MHVLYKVLMLIQKKVVCDLEKVVISALKIILGDDIWTHGWFHHLTQATWRKIQNLGLTVLYTESKDIRMFCDMMDGMGFYQSIL